jgi:hypothetical protein
LGDDRGSQNNPYILNCPILTLGEGVGVEGWHLIEATSSSHGQPWPRRAGTTTSFGCRIEALPLTPTVKIVRDGKQYA